MIIGGYDRRSHGFPFSKYCQSVGREPAHRNPHDPRIQARLKARLVSVVPLSYASRDPHARTHAPFNSYAGVLNYYRSSLLVGRRVGVGQNAAPGFESCMLFLEQGSNAVGSHAQLFTYEGLPEETGTEENKRNDPGAG